MRRIIYSVAVSLDGFIAGPNGEADWIPMDPDIDFNAIWARFDTLLMGRRTFDTMPPSTGESKGPSVVVASRTLRAADHPKVKIIGMDLRREVSALKAAPGKDIWLFGGGELFRSCLNYGLVDGVEVAIVPVLLGGGLPLVPNPAKRAPLTLTSHRVYPRSGIVSLEYSVTP